MTWSSRCNFFKDAKKITSVGWSSRCKFFWNALDPVVVIFFCNNLIKYLESFDSKFFMAGFTWKFGILLVQGQKLPGSYKMGFLLPALQILHILRPGASWCTETQNSIFHKIMDRIAEQDQRQTYLFYKILKFPSSLVKVSVTQW